MCFAAVGGQVRLALCGVRVILGWRQKGWVGGSGSSAITAADSAVWSGEVANYEILACAKSTANSDTQNGEKKRYSSGKMQHTHRGEPSPNHGFSDKPSPQASTRST